MMYTWKKSFKHPSPITLGMFGRATTLENGSGSYGGVASSTPASLVRKTFGKTTSP
jgi:hypothetical protein